ncbi:MAG TPA: alpha/beta hydrolase [Azospirillaceae bacterium]|nr:alpha/beta hydrolase [Azospirillaceae bacterium]
MIRRLGGAAARLVAGLAALAGLAGCKPVDALNAVVPKAGFTRVEAVAYAPGPRRMLDVYRPRDLKGPAPVVVFLYGGKWSTGDRGDYLFVGEALASRGLVAVIPDYRLYPAHRFPAFMEDAALAVAWAARHAAEQGGDPGRVVVMGHSAGAHIAALLALDPRWLAGAGVADGALAGMVGLAGPYDFLPFTDPVVIGVFQPAEADLKATQPISFVRRGAPPLLLLSGDADDTVRPRNSRALADAQMAAGGRAEARFYPGMGHIGIITALAAPFRRGKSVLDDAAGFIHALPSTAEGRRSGRASGG